MQRLSFTGQQTVTANGIVIMLPMANKIGNRNMIWTPLIKT
ncbi:hypothetical protein N9B53_01970 [Mariniblastus sp.]|nr:hypothetical protein [Mariniblastus sp.]